MVSVESPKRDTATRPDVWSWNEGHSKGMALDGAGMGQRLARTSADTGARKRVNGFERAFIAAVGHDLHIPPHRCGRRARHA